MSVVQFYPLPCVVSLVVKTGDCESPYEGSIPSRHPNEKSSNGRTPPFEGVYLGSSPSFSASPIDGIGIHTCLRNKVLQVRVLYRALEFISKFSWVSVIGNTAVSKTAIQSSSLWPLALSF
jgi:hypothetical protein